MDVSPAQKRILVVDDEPLAHLLIGEIAEELGYEVTKATTTEEGVAKVPAFRPDILVCDLTMGHPGPYFEGVRQLREALGATVPIVVYSGYVLPQHEKAARQAGCSEFVWAFDLKRLRAVLQPRS